MSKCSRAIQRGVSGEPQAVLFPLSAPCLPCLVDLDADSASHRPNQSLWAEPATVCVFFLCQYLNFVIRPRRTPSSRAAGLAAAIVRGPNTGGNISGGHVRKERPGTPEGRRRGLLVCKRFHPDAWKRSWSSSRFSSCLSSFPTNHRFKRKTDYPAALKSEPRGVLPCIKPARFPRPRRHPRAVRFIFNFFFFFSDLILLRVQFWI